ncbi:hypothetical protein [Streptomyces sp. Ncost-T10-10d]|nr:hypothetical protein [Streptomyces sp. Ncost-T10-10d]
MSNGARIVLPGYALPRGYKALRLFKDVQQRFPTGTWTPCAITVPYWA